MVKRIVCYLNDCQRIIVVDAQLRSKREQHASVVLLGQLFLLGGGWESKTIEVTISVGGCLGVQDHWGGQALWLVAIVIMVLTGCNKAKSQMAVPRGEMFDWNVGPNLTEVCHRSCAVKVGIQAPFRVSPALWSQISILCRKSLICKDTKVSPTEVMILGSGSGSGRAVTLYQVLRNPR